MEALSFIQPPNGQHEEKIKMKQNYGFHGDVHVIESEIPVDAVETDETVLEYGEVTGHAHRMNGDGFKILKTPDNRKFLRVIQPSDLSHEEHHTRTIQPGDYEIRRTRETDHMTGVTRVVAD